MDKNFIHIDELVRGRLSGLEGKEPPGSWERMKELLDQEMPSNPRGGAAPLWRRRLFHLGGWLLVSAVAAGGYYFISGGEDLDSSYGQRSEMAVMSPMPKPGMQENTPIASVLQDADNQDVKSRELKQELNESTESQPLNPSPSAIASSQGVAHVTDGNISESKTGSSAEKGALPGSNTSSWNGDQTDGGHPSPSLASASIRKPDVIGLEEKVEVDPDLSLASLDLPAEQKWEETPQGDIAGNALKNNELSLGKSREDLSYTPPTNPRTMGEIRSGTERMDPVSPDTREVPMPSSPSPNAASNTTSSLSVSEVMEEGLAKVQDNTLTKLGQVEGNTSMRRDTMKKIETRETYSREGKWQKDTIDMGLVEYLREEEEPALAVSQSSHASNTLGLHVTDHVGAKANLPSLDKEEGEWVPLSSFRVDSRASKAHYRKANLFEEMVRNAKFKLGRAKFYPGLVAGVHSSMSKYSLSGFQIGVSGNLSLNEKWGIHSEIRYKHSFNGKVYKDESYIGNLDTTTTTQGSMISYDSVSSEFQYSTVSRFEMPIMLSYSLRRWIILGGGVLSYQMAVDAQDVSKTYAQQFYQGLGSVNLERRNPGIHVNDFGSRWAAGCLIGLGYQLSPAIRLDARWTQPLWNDASTTGSQKLSQSIFYRPQAEIQMNFRFSSNKYKPFRESK